MKPCTEKHHSWVWQENRVKCQHFNTSVRLTSIGIYQCRHCEARKYGQAKNGGSLECRL